MSPLGTSSGIRPVYGIRSKALLLIHLQIFYPQIGIVSGRGVPSVIGPLDTESVSPGR